MMLRRFFQWLFNPTPTPTPTPTPLPTPTNPTTTEGLISAINIERTTRNLNPLIPDVPLTNIAQDWANQMASNELMSHGDFSSRIVHVYPNTAAGEDIAEGQQTVSQVVLAWMNSPPHRANILGYYNLIGVGFATGKRSNMIYWCIDFDRRA